MKFCTICENVCSTKICATTEILKYECRYCMKEFDIINNEDFIVCKTQIKQKKAKHCFQQYINECTKFDPTLPRTRNLPCPNISCATNISSTNPREIIIIRYDEVNLFYMFLCSTCNTVWDSIHQDTIG